jgi:hypothetical protein
LEPHCCFRQELVSDTDDNTIVMTVTAAKRLNEQHPASQGVWCHSTCLGTRLAPNVPFLFDD